MIAYQTNADWVYVHPVECDPDPLNPGNFLVPGHAVLVEPPVPGKGEWARWDGEQWIVEKEILPEPDFPEPIIPPLTREMVELNRQAAYARYSDPIFFRWQRGDATQEEWLAEIEAIKIGYPYPEESDA